MVYRLETLTSDCASNDVVIYAKNRKDLKYNLHLWNKILKKSKLKMNTDKTEVMVMGQNDVNFTIALNEETIEQIERFKYVGVKIQKNGKY